MWKNIRSTGNIYALSAFSVFNSLHHCQSGIIVPKCAKSKQKCDISAVGGVCVLFLSFLIYSRFQVSHQAFVNDSCHPQSCLAGSFMMDEVGVATSTCLHCASSNGSVWMRAGRQWSQSERRSESKALNCWGSKTCFHLSSVVTRLRSAPRCSGCVHKNQQWFTFSALIFHFLFCSL